jgi:hypothetical protein
LIYECSAFAPQVPLTQTGRFLPVMWIWFWVNAVSGVLLPIGHLTKALTNPVFYAKLTLIAIAMVVLRSITRHVLSDPSVDEQPLQGKGRLLAAASLVCWIGVIFTGRFLAGHYVRSATAALSRGDFRPSSRYRLSVICQSDLQKRANAASSRSELARPAGLEPAPAGLEGL